MVTVVLVIDTVPAQTRLITKNPADISPEYTYTPSATLTTRVGTDHKQAQPHILLKHLLIYFAIVHIKVNANTSD